MRSPMPNYILAIDQGTTGSTALIVNQQGATIGRHTVEFPQHFPQPAWVEHEPSDIWRSVEEAVTGALQSASISASALAAIGITNQRETTLVWDRASGIPLQRAIVWQDRRTAEVCAKLRDEGATDDVRTRTGLVIDPYFSATKIAWILDHVPGARERGERGDLAFGTVDSFLVYKLTGGSAHVTDISNASRTLLMNLRTGAWDDTLLKRFFVPRAMMPTIVGSAEVVGKTRGVSFLPDGIPISGIAGDQQAALFGQCCFDVGDAKCTYGTGAFVLMNIGPQPTLSRHGLVTTVAWKIGSSITYALEGSAFIAGAAIQWLRDGLGIIRSASEVEALAASVPSTDGVVFVPALAGLGAPYWDADARGAILGLTRGSTAAHIARATLEGVAFEVRDLLAAMGAEAAADGEPKLKRLRVDGGASRNGLMMQFQADISDILVDRPREIESTGRGAAMLAGVGSRLFPAPNEPSGKQALSQMRKVEATFAPTMSTAGRAQALAKWHHGVAQVRLRAES